MKRIGIITGSSSGMGECFARQAAVESALLKKHGKDFFLDELWLIARREDRLKNVKLSIEKEALQKNIRIPLIKIFSLDISGSEGALKIKELLEKEAGDFSIGTPNKAGTLTGAGNGTLNNNGAGGVDTLNAGDGGSPNDPDGLTISLLVNNAGFGTYGEFASTDTMREMQMIDLDCTTLTGITGFALPYMKKGSRIINTASLASFMPLGNFAVYGACKAYVLSFSVALAAELKPKGISVTALCPGPVSTEFADVASKGARKEVRHGLSPEKTVAHCLKASRRKKLYSMFAFKWKFKAIMSRFIGRYAGAWFTFKYCKRPSN